MGLLNGCVFGVLVFLMEGFRAAAVTGRNCWVLCVSTYLVRVKKNLDNWKQKIFIFRTGFSLSSPK